MESAIQLKKVMLYVDFYHVQNESQALYLPDLKNANNPKNCEMKSIHCLELCQQNAPLVTRERFNLRMNEGDGPIKKLKESDEEIFIISTCNRLSIYSFAESNKLLLNAFREENISQNELVKFSGKDAVEHLLRTCAQSSCVTWRSIVQ